VNPRPTIAACMIVRNGAQTIERCIASIRPHVDEIAVYLGGISTDATVEILARLATEPGAPIIVEQGEWRDDYAEARNRSFAMASCGYVIWLDDDETLHGGEHLRGLLSQALVNKDLSQVNTSNHLPDTTTGTGDVLTCRGPGPTWGDRVVRAAAGASWHGIVHETLHLPEGALTTVVDPAVLHVTHDPVAADDRHDHVPLMKKAVLAGDMWPALVSGAGPMSYVRDPAVTARLLEMFIHSSVEGERGPRDNAGARCCALVVLAAAYCKLGDFRSARAAWRDRQRMVRAFRQAARAGESGPAVTSATTEFFEVAMVAASGSSSELAKVLADRGLRLRGGRVVEDPRLDDLAFASDVFDRAMASGRVTNRLPVDVAELRVTYGIAS
jgi:hypothetical protein